MVFSQVKSGYHLTVITRFLVALREAEPGTILDNIVVEKRSSLGL